MARRTNLGNPNKFKERRERKIDNLLQSTNHKRNSVAFKKVYKEIQELQFTNFRNFEGVQFINFKANLKYVQTYSGLNQIEFCTIAGITTHAISEVNQYPNTIPIHSFIKAYSIMQYYLPSIEFCDMFQISFKDSFPFLQNNLQNNRLKLGKSIRKEYTFKQK